jgi:UDP-glucose 4-epimerase
VRIVVVGATGNAGTSVLRALTRDDEIKSILGIARRRPVLQFPRTTWLEADVSRADLTAHFEGADVVIHLAWLIQPSRDERITHATNVEGSARLFAAAARAGVPAVVYASSVGAYSTGPKDRGVDESWPTNGVSRSYYSRQKAAVERILDSFEAANPEIRVVRIRPAFIFKREAASGIRRLFAGPFLPRALLRRELIPVVPGHPRLRFQGVHSHDIGEAYRSAALREVRGAFNIAADPILDSQRLAKLLGARTVSTPGWLLRTAASVTWRARLQPTSPDWIDLGLALPIMDTTRARTELQWQPRYDAEEAFMELFEGMREGAGTATPPLDPDTGGPARVRELLTGVGRTSR